MNTKRQLREIVSAACRVGRLHDLSKCIYGVQIQHGAFLDKSMNYYRFLSGLAELTEARCIVEIGTHSGGSTLALRAGQTAHGGELENPAVITLDVDDLVGEAFAGDPAIQFVKGDILDDATFAVCKRLLGKRKIDILYVDALKDGGFVQRVIERFAGFQPAFIVLDDISPNESMWRKWLEITVRTPGVSISDVVAHARDHGFGMGILANRSGVAEQVAAAARRRNGAEAFDLVRVGTPYAYRPKRYDSAKINKAKKKPGLAGWLAPLLAGGASKGGETAKRKGTPKFMTRPAELGLLHRLAATAFKGDGEIVDAGTFLGASALALGRGLSERTDSGAHLKRVHSYDLFLHFNSNFDVYFDGKRPRWSRFLDDFLRNTESVSRFINVYEGDFTVTRWIGKPIEIFFCDIAKSPLLNAHVYREFEPHWIPGTTIYVQQDFVHMEAPWIQYALGSIIDCFSVIGIEEPSLALGYVTPIDERRLARIVADDFTLEEKLQNLDNLAAAIDNVLVHATMELIKVRLLSEAGRHGDAEALFGECQNKFGSVRNRRLRNRFKRMRPLLDRHRGLDVRSRAV